MNPSAGCWEVNRNLPKIKKNRKKLKRLLTDTLSPTTKQEETFLRGLKDHVKGKIRTELKIN